ncbi:MAG: hypothetical protein WD646_00550 [Actinomycetota bacterium]
MAAAICAVAPVRAADPLACDERSWVGGTAEWCDGKLVYRDYVYDDTGADTDSQNVLGRNGNAISGSPHGAGLTKATGDVLHTDHGQALNSADLLTLRLWKDGESLRAHFQLNTLFPDDRTLAAIAIDTDNDPSTGGGYWAPSVMNVRSAGWDVAHVFDQRDVTSNVIEGSMPFPSGDRWRIQAVISLGDGTPMNVAFRPGETGAWWEQKQSAELATGDVSAFGQRIDVGDLLSGTTNRPAPLPGPGLWERVYTSGYPVGEGVNYEGVTFPGVRGTYHYLGRHQPYAIYVPSPDSSDTYGLQFALHGASAAHGSLVGGAGMQYAFGELLRSLGDKPRLVVVPLGRGPNGGYIDYSLRDVLDVHADVLSHYPVDRDRMFAGGYSMGGGGTFLLASLFPDRFAGAINWVGFTGDCLNGTPLAQGRQRPVPPIPGLWKNDPPGCVGAANIFDYLEGARHVPQAMVFAAADELVWATHAVALMQRYDELDYEHVLWLYAAEHLTFAILDNWDREAVWSANRKLVHNPARVSYRTNPFLWFEPADIKPDGAYWVKDLVPRSDDFTPGGDVVVELTSHRCAPHAEYTNDLTSGAGLEPLPWISQEGQPRWHQAIEQDDRISGTLTNAKSVTIDVSGACMGAGPIELDIAVDGPTTITFSDGRPSVQLGAVAGRDADLPD